MVRGVLTVLSLIAAAAAAHAADYGRYATPEAAVLAVEAPFAPPGGAVRVTAYASAATFLNTPAHRFEGVVNADGVAVLDLAALAPGDYAFAAYFDADGDGKLKRGRLGRPREPFVFSNNVRPRLSRPKWIREAIPVRW